MDIKGEKYYNDINKIFEDLTADFNILEEQIDIEVQMKYFEFSNKMREEGQDPDLFKNGNELFSKETGIKRKKEILSSLAIVDDVKAYRIIEKFLKQADSGIRNWAVMALQESRMVLRSNLLDEKQVFISTGLGGKGQKLRFYVVFINRSSDKILNFTQQKVVKNELIFALDQEDGIFESIDFSEGFTTSLLLLPVRADINKIFGRIIEECNQYGNFLDEDMIITNVKILSRNEILNYIEHKKKNRDVEDDEYGLEE
jgi:hypothetical protein